jgi:DNA-binding MarR family transcriptional regulator
MEINEQDLLEKFSKLTWLLRRNMIGHLRDHGPMGAPYQGQGRILSLLKLTPEISQKELAHILNIRSQSLGELLAKLEHSGYITRTPSEVDRRGMDIRLTESGKAVSEKEVEPEQQESFFDCLNEEEQTTLSDYLERLIKNLEEQQAEGGSDNFSRPSFGGRGRGNPFQRGEGRGPADFGGLDSFLGGDRRQFPFGGHGTVPFSRGDE